MSIYSRPREREGERERGKQNRHEKGFENKEQKYKEYTWVGKGVSKNTIGE